MIQASHATRTKLKPLSHTARVATFGAFTYAFKPTASAPGAIEVDRRWLANNIVTIEIPQLAIINGGKPRKAQFHRLAAPRFQLLFEAWGKAGLVLHVSTWNGSLVQRYKRGQEGGDSSALSNHSWGTAVDINAQWNRLGQKPAALGEPGSVIPLVAIANELGFAWGGDFSNPDGMHFECVRLTSEITQ